MVRILCFVFLLVNLNTYGQHQLLVIKNDAVMIRYLEGDDFVYKRKSLKKPVHAYIISINDSTIITNMDTVATHQIERVYFRKGNFLNVVGGFLVTGGALIFLIDQVNVLVVQGADASIDKNVASISLLSIGLGLPMMLLRKNTHRVGFKKRLRIIDRNSPFYYEDSRFQPDRYNSHYIPRN
jgi:hypothetical protein